MQHVCVTEFIRSATPKFPRPHLVAASHQYFGTDGNALRDAACFITSLRAIGVDRGCDTVASPLEVSWIRRGVVVRSWEISLVDLED